jgi:hypothetical protein
MINLFTKEFDKKKSFTVHEVVGEAHEALVKP